MSPKQEKKKQPKAFDVHRTLPNSTYRPRPAATQSAPLIVKGQTNRSPSVEPETKEKKARRFGWKKRISLLLVVLITPVLIIAFLDLRNASRASEIIFGDGNILGLLTPSSLEKSTDGRTNVLLIGYSADDPEHAGALLTDSIMVLSMDGPNKKGYTLSIPRDLYVKIPEYGSAKINEAFQAGEQAGFSESGYALGGAGLLQKIIERDFGIDTQYYAIINYGAVRDTVDALDGVTVEVKSPDPRGLFDPNFRPQEGGPLTLANGPQRLDGQTALRLTRARGSTYGSYGFPQSDFNRTQNQQAVLSAIKNELDWKLLLDPRENADIFNAIATNIKTDLDISEVAPLYRLFKSVPSESQASVSLRDVNGVNLLASYQTPTGQSALIPAAGISDFSDIRAAIKKLQ